MKRFLTIMGGLTAVVLTAVIALSLFLLTFDANDNKDWIARKFQEQTGRTLSLDGNIDVTFYPWLGVTAERVAIGNATGFSDTPLLAANSLALRLKLLPLLRSRYEIDTVQVDGLHLNLEVAGNGLNNWSTLRGSPAAAGNRSAAEPAAEGSANSAFFNNIVIGGVNITDTSIEYGDTFADRHYEINDFNMSIGELVYGHPLDLRLGFDAVSYKPELAAQTMLEGTVVYDMDRGRYDFAPLQLQSTLRGPGVPGGSAALTLDTALTIDVNDDTLTLNDLVLSGLGMHVTANVEAADLQAGEPAVSATLEANGSDLAVLFQILQQDALAGRISTLDSSFSLVASLEADLGDGTLKVPMLQARLLNADIDGSVSVERFTSAAPALQGALNAQGPDLATLIEVAGMLQGGSDSTLSQTGRDLSRLPDKTFRITTDFAADLDAATLAVPQFELTLFGASISGNIDASNIKDSTALRASGTLDASGPDLPLLLQIAGRLQGGMGSPLDSYGEKLRLGVQDRAFNITTSFNADLGRGNIELPALNARLLGFTVTAQLNALDLQSSNGIVNGKLQLSSDQLREVLTVLDQAALGEVAQSLQLDVEVGGTSSNLRLSPLRLDLVLAGRQIGNSPQTLRLSADTIANLDEYSVSTDSFSLSGLGLELQGSVAAANLNTAPNFDGRLEIPAFDARRFMQQLNQELPPTSDGSVLQKVALSTAFGGTQSSFNLNDMTLLLDESTITGSLAVSDLATMASQFTLNVDTINADRYLAPASGESAASDADATALPQEELQALRVQGSITIGQLVINRLQMSDIVMEINAANGELALTPFHANLYQGSFDGNIRLDTNGAAPLASVTTTLSNVDLGPLLQDFMGSSYVSGKGNISLSLRGSGADAASIRRNLNGNGSLQLQDGVLQGVDVSAVLASIETMIRSRRTQSLPEGGSTAFEESAATLAIAEGVIRTGDLSVKAPGWSLAGNGILADLGNERMDFNLLVSVDESTVTSADTEYDLGGYTLPIACNGALDSPRCLPDARQILASAVGSVLQERLGNFLQERLGGGRTQEEATSAEPAQ